MLVDWVMKLFEKIKSKRPPARQNSPSINETDELIKIYIESFRFLSMVKKIVCALDESKQRRYAGRISWYEEQWNSIMSTRGFNVFCKTGIDYEPGILGQIQNLEDFDSEEQLVIEKWNEPTIIDKDGKILHQGIALVGRK